MTKQQKFTELGNPTIRQTLVGKKPQIYIKPDENGISQIDGKVRFFDNYLRKLCNYYPFSIFGTQRNEIANPKDPLGQDYFSDEPGLVVHAESLLVRILQESALAGFWQPEIIELQTFEPLGIKSPEDYLQVIERINPSNKPMGELDKLLYGINNAWSKGFVFPSHYRKNGSKSKTYLLAIPSQRFVEHVIKTFKTS